MGRRKKNATVSQDISSFEFSKEDGLTIFTKEKISIPQDVVDLFDIKPVSNPSKLSGNIAGFNGKTYKESLELAYQWRDRNNGKEINPKVRLENYYPQSFMQRSVLVGYTILKEKEAT